MNRIKMIAFAMTIVVMMIMMAGCSLNDAKSAYIDDVEVEFNEKYIDAYSERASIIKLEVVVSNGESEETFHYSSGLDGFHMITVEDIISNKRIYQNDYIIKDVTIEKACPQIWAWLYFLCLPTFFTTVVLGILFISDMKYMKGIIFLVVAVATVIFGVIINSIIT